jgi:hypothetical protein
MSEDISKRVITPNQRKAILEIDPKATFSEDGSIVYTCIVYDYLCDIFDNID